MQIEYPYDDQSPTPCRPNNAWRDAEKGGHHLGMTFAPHQGQPRLKWHQIGSTFENFVASKARLHTGKKARRAADKKRRTSLVRTARISHLTGTRTTETENQHWFDRTLFVSIILGAYSNAH